MSIDLKALSPKELQKLISEASREHKRKQKRAPIASVRTRLTRLAAAEGYSLVELFGLNSGAVQRAPKPPTGKPAKPARTARGPSKGSKVAPKYRNPGNPAETWSGRGVHPRWMAALVASGRKPEDFLI